MSATLPSLENECFFIAPIGENGSEERRRSDGILNFVVAHAAEELGLRAVRADQLAEPGQITRQVVDHVLRARAAVADLTFLNPNVFYELAVRHTARLPTVLIVEEGERLPFDIAQMRTIFFRHDDLQSADECRHQIVQHLREAFEGSVDSPIATSIDLQSLQAWNRAERRVAEHVTTVEDLSRNLADELEAIRVSTKETLERTRSPHGMTLKQKDIQYKEFTKAMRGYAMHEVDTFLDEVNENYGRLEEEVAQLRYRVSEFEKRMPTKPPLSRSHNVKDSPRTSST
jgi:DivIVA domain-containing protein